MAIGTGDENEPVCQPTRTQCYVWGYNINGQTGHEAGLKGDPRSWRCQRTPLPVPVQHFGNQHARLSSVACGLAHTAVVTVQGALFTWGSNEFGQLGDGSEEDSRVPRRVEALQSEQVKSVACGAHCSAAITQPRGGSRSSSYQPECGDLTKNPTRLWVWGRNQGSNYPRLFHGAFHPLMSVIQVACGADHCAAVSSDGQLQTWGYNEHGQLGFGFASDGLQRPRLVTLFARHTNEAPLKVPVARVACGDFHTACISQLGEVYTWGWGQMGQLGHRSLQSSGREVLPRRVVSLEGVEAAQVACGQVHTAIVTKKGALHVWGGHREGQLGLGPVRQVFPVLAETEEEWFRRLPTVLMTRGVELITCGQSHMLAACSDGRLLGWGYNSCGQAATGKAAYAWHPTAIDWCVGEVCGLAAGGGHSAVLTRACTLKDLCELKLADNLRPETIPSVEDAAASCHAESLLRLCNKLRACDGRDDDVDEDEERRRRPRNKTRGLELNSVSDFGQPPTGRSSALGDITNEY